MKYCKDVLGALFLVVLYACGPATEKANMPKAEAMPRASAPAAAASAQTMRPAAAPASTATAPAAVRAPVYRDGDWWKVKVEFEQKGFSRSGMCFETYPEYLVRIVDGKPRTYGVTGTKEEEIECTSITRELFDIPDWQYLKFPMTVGATWSGQYVRPTVRGREGRTIDTEHRALAWEKVRTPKGEFDAFKIQRLIGGNPQETLYYAPEAKAVVVFERDARRVHRMVTLVDYHVGP